MGAIFNDTSVNNGTVSNDAIFNNTSHNDGTVSGNATFNDSAYNTNTVTGDATFTASTYDKDPVGTVSGTVTFNSATPVAFTIDGVGFGSDSTNWIFTTAGQNWTFNNSSVNHGTVTGDATFNYSVNYMGGVVTGNATFNDISYNSGTVTENATFNDSSSNGAPNGTVTGDATFNDSSSNYDTVSGNATFNDSSYNEEGTVTGNAIFNDYSYNNTYGIVTGNASYNGSSSLLLIFNGDFLDSSGHHFPVSNFGASLNPSIGSSNFPPRNGVSFDGAGSWLDISHNPALNLGTTDFTIEGWINFNAVNDGDTLLSKGTANGYTLYYYAGALYMGVPYVSNDLSGPWTPIPSFWYHIAASRKDSILRLFVDGIQIAQGSNSINYTSGASIRIGQTHSGSYVNAYMDDIRITADGLYTENFSPPSSELTRIEGFSRGLLGSSVGGVARYNGLTGMSTQNVDNGIYYIGGESTPLNLDGTGYWGDKSTYYIAGFATTLDSGGNGVWNGHAYYNATLQPTGYNGYFYYISDVETSLDSNGDGCWNNSPYSSGNRTFDPSTDTGYNTCDSLYYVSGVSTSLDSSGYGDYNGLHYSAYPTEYGGYDAFTSYYYIAGVQTTLDSAGTGFYDGHAYLNGTAQPTGWNTLYYYINDVETTLDSNGSGFYDGHAYYNDVLQPTGYNGYFYYINDVETTLNPTGTGCWNNSPYSYGYREFDPSTDTGYNTCDSLYYVSGVSTSLNLYGYGDYNGLHYSVYPTEFNGVDYNNYTWYIAGNQTSLDTGGNGVWNGNAYWGGYAQATGYNGYFYYINDVETTLDSNGNGIWETRNYFSGNSAGQPGTDIRYMRYYGCQYNDYWDNLNNWQVCFSNNGPQTDWGGSTSTAGALPTSLDFCLISGYACSTPSNSNSQPVCNTLYMDDYSNGPYVWASWYPINVVHAIILGINRFDIYASSETTFSGGSVNYGTLTGDVIFQNNSQNSYDSNGLGSIYYNLDRIGKCNSGASFYDTSSNHGYIEQPWWDLNNTYAYFGEVNGGQAIFWDNSTNNGKCSAGATFHNNSKNLFGITGGVTLAYDKGINGSNILGIF